MTVSEKPDQTYGQNRHIKSPRDFERVFKTRCRSFDSILLVFGAPNGLTRSRLGLSVSKKIGNSPQRNHWKRLIREAFRRNSDQIPAGYDYVVIPQKQKDPPRQEAVTQSLLELIDRVVRKIQKRQIPITNSRDTFL